jgi:hypothetical protein
MTMFHESEWACAGLKSIEPRRFIAGGVAVFAFAALGDFLRPKSFAGLFGAAPSIALATILITLWKKGALFV